jgi:hypothetical protein
MAAVPLYVYGLSDIKLTSADGEDVVDLPAARQLRFSERLVSGALRGDDQTVARFAQLDAVEWTMEAGGYTMEAVALMTGRTIGSSGTTPNIVKTLPATAGGTFPYFKIQGKSLGEGGEDVWIEIPKAQLTAPPNGTFQDSQYFLSAISGEGISDGTSVYKIIWHETAVALPAET